jgi:hypothetical protein
MARPLHARGAKSKANLRRGGPGRPRLTEQDKEVRKISKRLLSSPAYMKKLKQRLESGAIQPGVEAMLFYYAYGKPQESVEVKQVVPVRITHEYSK